MINPWFVSKQSQDPLIIKYQQYRRMGKKTSSEIMERFSDEQSIRTIGKLFGIFQGKSLVIASESEAEALMDFSIYEYQVDGHNFIQCYLEAELEIEPELKVLLESKLKSYTSLFRIIQTDSHRSRTKLLDLFNSNEVEIIDINLSRTAQNGTLLFTRIVPLPDFNMSSGMYFAFDKALETNILSRLKISMKRVKSEVESIKRFVAFFKLSRIHGAEFHTTDI